MQASREITITPADIQLLRMGSQRTATLRLGNVSEPEVAKLSSAGMLSQIGPKAPDGMIDFQDTHMGKEFFGALEKVFRSARFSGIGQPKSPITLKVGDTVFNVALTRPTPFERTIIDAAAHSGYQLGKVLNAAGMSDEVIVKQAEEEKSRIEDRRVSNSARFNRETRGEDLQYAAGLIQRLLVDIRGGFAQAPSTASPKELEDIAISMQERSYDFFRLPKGSPYA